MTIPGRELPGGGVAKAALTVDEFCSAHGISRAFFYKLRDQGRGPRIMKVGARTLISCEASAEWRRASEIA
jgi:hypothetical protein